ncbi:MAG: hypothetical protein ACXAC5_04510 [Promethearchaeota archaeon]|jgi:hypothetical protein
MIQSAAQINAKVEKAEGPANNMELYYAGIGSRTTPYSICGIMTEIAKILNSEGYILRSGGAEGADTAFKNGAGDAWEVFRPKDATPEAIEEASKFHPAWHNCNDYVRRLHGRNAQIILGRDLDKPVEFTMLWTPGGKTIGGTGLGIRISDHHKITIKNLYDPEILNEILVQYSLERLYNEFVQEEIERSNR